MTDYKCNECNKIFASKESLDQHNNHKHMPKEVKKPMSSSTKKNIVFAVILILIAGSFGFIIFSQPASNNSHDDANIPKFGIHWHPTLHVYVNNQEIPIPANLGLAGGHLPVHTHDPDNVLHYEFDRAPTADELRLGYFFERVWRKTFSSECILEYCNNETHSVKFFVNGAENFEYDDYIVQEIDKMEIRYERNEGADIEK